MNNEKSSWIKKGYEKSMRENKTFGDKKLTRQEFSKKYWLDGDAPDQYHTAEIEDGRDER